MTLPSASTRLSVQAGTAAVSTDLIAVWAAVSQNADGVPRLYANLKALLDTHGYCLGAEYAALHMEETGKPVLFVPMPIGTAGAMGRQESVHTGTSAVSAAAATGGILAGVDAIVQVQRGGTVGTDQIILSVSLDGGKTYLPARVGTASTYTVPNIGVVITLGAGTLVAGDTILLFKTSAPIFDATGVTLGKSKMEAQQLITRTWLFIGDVPTLALGQAIQSAASAYETEAERYIRAKFQARDWRIVKSSRVRVAMVGAPQVTFAASGFTATRSAGSFVTDGFQVGDYVRITGSVSNNVSAKVTGVTATVLTFASGIVNEGPVSNVSITAEPTFTFASAGKTITRNRGSWLTDGFAVGDVVTVAGSASNNGTFTIATLTATVMTVVETVADETAGSVSCTVSFTESDTAWQASIAALFAPIDGAPRVDKGGGRLTRLSPITGYTMRRPVQWADSCRNYQHDISTTTWWKDLGPLQGWGIDGEHDERVNPGLLDNRFTCARTWSNGPSGAFIAQSLTCATDGNILGLSHNMDVANLAQTVVQRATENFVGQTLVLNPPDTTGKRTAKPASLAVLAAKVNSELQRNLLERVNGEGPRASFAQWIPATDDDLGVAGATLHGTCELGLNGTIVKVATSVEVQ